MFLPWWVQGVLCFALSLGWDKSPADSFLKCALSQGLLWLLLMVYQDMQNDSILSTRIASMFRLPHPYALIALIFVVISLLNGLAGFAGAHLRIAIRSLKMADET